MERKENAPGRVPLHRNDDAPAGGDAAPHAERAFVNENRRRWRRFERAAAADVVEALSFVPFLLHLNQPGLPGWLSAQDCPCGVVNYAPSRTELERARVLFPQAPLRKAALLRPVVELVALVGAAAVTYTPGAPLHLCVCFRNAGLDEARVSLFVQKVQALQDWLTARPGCAGAHLVLLPVDDLRAEGPLRAQGGSDQRDDAACWKADLYGASLLLAGNRPLWWVTPPVEEGEAVPQRVNPPTGYVDLGPVAPLNPAALFRRLVGRVTDPSVGPAARLLTMAHLERTLLSDRPFLLCEGVKRTLLAGSPADPDCVLLEELLAFFLRAAENDTADLLAGSFSVVAFAAGESLPGDPSAEGIWGARWCEDLGWDRPSAERLQGYAAWKVRALAEFSQRLDEFYVGALDRLHRAKTAAKEACAGDLEVWARLDRWIHARHAREPVAVGELHRLLPGPGASSLVLWPRETTARGIVWLLFESGAGASPEGAPEVRAEDLLLSSAHVDQLLLWAIRNGALTARTTLVIRDTQSLIAQGDVERLCKALTAFLPHGVAYPATPEGLMHDEHPVGLLVVPPLGRDDKALLDLTAVYPTSWGRLLCRRWTGASSFREFAEDVLIPFLVDNPSPGDVHVFVPQQKVRTMSGVAGELQRQLPLLAADLGGQSFPDGLRRRWVGMAEDGYYVFERVGSQLTYRSCASLQALLHQLSTVGPLHRTQTRIEARTGELSILKAMTECAAEGYVDVYVLERAGAGSTFVIDEAGNFAEFPHSADAELFDLAHLLVFVENVLPLVKAQPGSPLVGSTVAQSVRIHRVVPEKSCRVFLSTRDFLSRVGELGLKPEELALERLLDAEGRQTGYSVRWGNEVIRSGEVADPLEELRGRIRNARRTGEHYGIFMTRLFLDERFARNHCGPFATTGHYLFYKKALERKLAS